MIVTKALYHGLEFAFYNFSPSRILLSLCASDSELFMVPEICHTHNIYFCNKSSHFIELEFNSHISACKNHIQLTRFSSMASLSWRVSQIKKIHISHFYQLGTIFYIITIVTHHCLLCWILRVFRLETLSYSCFYLATICITWHLAQCITRRRYSIRLNEWKCVQVME